jgi:hypothetical protein
MVNLSVQTMATINDHATKMNASLQQLTVNTSQLHQRQQAIMSQMAMMSLGGTYQGAAAAVTLQKLHMPHHRSTNPQHYPTINKGATTHPNKLDGMDARRDTAVDAVAVGADDHMVEGVHRCPYHMLEEHSWSCTFREECSMDNMPHAKCIQTKQSGTQTRTCATRAALTLKIGTRVQNSNARIRDTRTASLAQTTCSMPKQSTHSARLQCNPLT